jgi:formylmethanofuran dehydrogenase subunit A
MWLDVKVSESAKISEDMQRRFREYWTVECENYPVTENYLEVSHPINVEAKV